MDFGKATRDFNANHFSEFGISEVIPTPNVVECQKISSDDSIEFSEVVRLNLTNRCSRRINSKGKVLKYRTKY